MRPQQNKRLRGRNNHSGGGRKGPNPLTRSFESNGPDVKIRGTAQHIAEKYLQLARDAQSSGDPVMAESYLQHAEHYYRVIAAAQQAQQQAMGLVPKPAQEVEEEDDGVEEDDRFASVADRLPQPPQPVYSAQPQVNGPQPHQNQPNGGQNYSGPNQGGERQQYGGGQRPWRDNRNNEGRGDRQDYRDSNRGEYRGNDNRQEGRQENRPEARQDNRHDNRPDNRGEQRFDNGGGERQDRPERNNQQWRNERRGPRNDVADAGPEGGALPSFITGARPTSDTSPAPAEQNDYPAAESGDQQGYSQRPRRRRRGRLGQGGEGDFGGDGNGNEPVASETAPVSD